MGTKRWISVTLHRKILHVPGMAVGIKVWAEDNQDALVVAESIISDKWVVMSAGPTRSSV